MDSKMKIGLYILIFFLSAISLFSTVQTGDILIFNGDTLTINNYYLENSKEFERYEKKHFPLFFTKINNRTIQSVTCTACYRGYIAEWIVIDSLLYLNCIHNCEYYEGNTKTLSLKSVFKNKVKDGIVLADWVTDDLIIEQGHRLPSNAQGETSEYSINLKFKHGRLLYASKQKNFDFVPSKYADDRHLFTEFIYQNINWDSIPHLDEAHSVLYISFTVTEGGRFENIDSEKGKIDQSIINELTRVLNLIPEWEKIYINEKFYQKIYRQFICLTEDNRKKSKER